MVRKPSSDSRIDPIEAQSPKIQLLDKHIDNARRVVLCDVVIQALR